MQIEPNPVIQRLPPLFMRSLRFIFLIPLLLASHVSLACECLWQGAFAEVYQNSDLVVMATVTHQQGNSLDIQVDELLTGGEYRDTLRIWGKTADLCRPEVSEFPLGSHWIMALTRIDQVPDGGFNPSRPNISFGREQDYFLSSCGVYWLARHKNHVSGNLTDAPRWQYLDPKKSPVLLSLFRGWLAGKVKEAQLTEAAHPQSQARSLLRDTRLFLKSEQWQEQQGQQPEGQ